VTCRPPAPFGTAETVTLGRGEQLGGLTVVLRLTLLLARLPSGVGLATLAVLIIVPAAVGVTTIVTVELAPLARAPTLQLTVPPVRLQVPLGAAELKLALGGSVSASVTLEAAPGPPLATVSV